MPKFHVSYQVPHSGETIIDADNIQQAREIAEDATTKAWADWEMLEDVSDATIVEITEIDEEDALDF